MPGQKIILIGGGGHCKSVIDVIESGGAYSIEGILDKEDQIGKQILGYPVIGTDDDMKIWADKGCSFLITIGQIKTAAIRAGLFARLKECGADIATVIAPTVCVSRHAYIAEGTVVLHGATVNAGARIGSNNIINTGSTIEHDAVTGSHCHISTHAVLNGDCILGDEIFLGSNSVVAQGVHIASKSIIGAGTVVPKHIAESGTYVGNPAKKII